MTSTLLSDRTFFTLAEEYALAQSGGAPPSAAVLDAETALAHARRKDPDHLRFRLTTFNAAVHTPDDDIERQRACGSVEPGDRALISFGALGRAHRALRKLEQAIDTALGDRTEELEDGVRALLSRWDSEGESLAFRRERAALRALATTSVLPKPIDAELSQAMESMLLRRFGLDEHEDAEDRLDMGRALAAETRLREVEVLRTRSRWSAPALDCLLAWAEGEGLLPYAPERVRASLDQVSRHLVALHDDLAALARLSGGGEVEGGRLGLLRWARKERLIDEGAEIVLLQAPIHTREFRR